MSRKARTDSGETKRSLIASAMEEFAEYGYEGASLRQICSKAGVTTGALYFFFDSKEDLFDSVISPLMREFPAIIAAWIEHDLAVICDGVGVPTNVEELADGLVELLEQNPLVPQIVLSSRDNPVVKKYLDSKVDEIAGSIESRVSKKNGKSSDGYSSHLLATICADAFIDVLANGEDLDALACHLSEISAFVRGGLEASLKR